jgi:hypothetical protein
MCCSALDFQSESAWAVLDTPSSARHSFNGFPFLEANLGFNSLRLSALELRILSPKPMMFSLVTTICKIGLCCLSILLNQDLSKYTVQDGQLTDSIPVASLRYAGALKARKASCLSMIAFMPIFSFFLKRKLNGKSRSRFSHPEACKYLHMSAVQLRIIIIGCTDHIVHFRILRAKNMDLHGFSLMCLQGVKGFEMLSGLPSVFSASLRGLP